MASPGPSRSQTSIGRVCPSVDQKSGQRCQCGGFIDHTEDGSPSFAFSHDSSRLLQGLLAEAQQETNRNFRPEASSSSRFSSQGVSSRGGGTSVGQSRLKVRCSHILMKY